MKAAIFNSYGSPDVLEIVDVPQPTIAANHVLVQVRSLSINPKDAVIRNGDFRLFTGNKFPQKTGFDFSGTVAQVEKTVTDLQVGDLVFGYIEDFKGGAAAEYVAVSSSWVALQPQATSSTIAAAMPCTYLTALQALRDKAKIRSGHRVLIYGASGGVGTAATQLAKHFGATVTAVSSAKNIDYCLANGADIALGYDKDEIFGVSKQYDIVFQVYAGQGNLYNVAKNALKHDGVFVTVIPNPLFALQGMFSKVLSLPKLETIIVKSSRADLELLAQLVSQGKINPQIYCELPLEKIAEAHRLIETKHTHGKIVLQVL